MRHYIVASPHVISEQASGETVVINLATGSYYNLNEEASKLWLLLLRGVDLDALGKADALEGFFSQLIQEGLIVPAPGAPAAPPDTQVNAHALKLEIYTDMQNLLGLDPIHEVEPQEGWPVHAPS